ncbi:MAG: primosomal protein N' [Desulfopila sp.]|jgi:primosomal protein N' (replication factor Y)|nr:primosomal protein N' [Desulfopila sp.]
MTYLEVAVAAPLLSTLTYLPVKETPAENAFEAASYIGHQVLVPLGRRTVTGYVLSCRYPEETGYAIKNIREVVTKEPLFPSNMVSFFRWIAEYYQSPIGEVISTAVPAGMKRTSRKIIHLNKKGAGEEKIIGVVGSPLPQWVEKLLNRKQLTASFSKKILSNPPDRKLIKILQKQGLIIIEDEISGQTVGDKWETCYSSSYSLNILSSDASTETEELKGFSDFLSHTFQKDFKLSEIKTLYSFAKNKRSSNDTVPQKDILRFYKGGGKALQELCRQGILKKISKRIYRNPFGEIPSELNRPEKLTSDQDKALDVIEKSIKNGTFPTFLLHGITGSGKTEVYLRTAERTLDLGKDVLVLVPEIALATQLESHFVSRFGQRIAVLHSGLSSAQKYDQWCLAASGKAKIVVGARSAVFAPLGNLGLIIVDEEHDSGFKQDDGVKYNGRDLAVLRGKMQNCPVILGSATPSITSFYHADTGKYHLLTMASRVGGSKLPSVRVIDLNKEKSSISKSGFHTLFLKELQCNLQNAEQSLVLLNRRGFSSSLICTSCGTSVQCKHCNVTLTYHKQKTALVCHYCGYSVNSRLICENCHSEKLVPMGAGTERIEEELSHFFPEARIARLDYDTARDRRAFLGILQKMRNREIDILVGTQMIAKGHHFPYVTFVGVVWADGGLNMPDFRAAEKTYQLLSQVTGRAGRGDLSGRVIIQTMCPDHYAIELARKHQYSQFFQKEVQIRQRPVFPPFVRLACYRVTGESEYHVRKSSENVARVCRTFHRKGQGVLHVLGPAPSPLEKIKDMYRWQVLLKAGHTQVFSEIGRLISVREKEIVTGKTRLSLDIDPENMM